MSQPMSSYDIEHQITVTVEKIFGTKIENHQQNFFELGGNSIQALEIVTAINELFNLEFNLSILVANKLSNFKV
jgi:acyl carrier protein